MATPYDGTDRSWVATGNGMAELGAQAITSGDNQLSNMGWDSATNGWGPTERNKSNGDIGAGDGRTISLNGQTYASGLGVHSNSALTFTLNGQCSTFASDIGVDEEVGTKGSVVFQVYADGIKLYDSGLMTGSSGTKNVNVSVAGRKQLKLVVTDAGDGLYYDHADWANARLQGCTATTSGGSTSGGSVTYRGPLEITKGGTYTGNYQSTDPNVPAIRVKTSEPVIIENANVKGPGDLIAGFGMNLTVRNTRGYGVNPNIAGRPTGRFLSAEENRNLNIYNNYMEGTGGIYVRAFVGDRAGGQTIKVVRNKARNIDGRKSNGSGGYQNAFVRYQFLQFNGVRDVPNVEIAWNEVINEPGKSALEENINMYQSRGTSGSRFKIHDNFIKGAYAINPTTDTGYAGGGILLGDGTSTANVVGGYVDVYSNHIVSTSNQGIGIAGGHNHSVYNNRIVSSGLLPDGRKIAAQNVGVYVWDSYGSKANGTWYNNVLRDNKITWMRYRSDGSSWQNNHWLPDCSSACYNNTNLVSLASLSTEQSEYAAWAAKVTAANLKIGPN